MRTIARHMLVTVAGALLVFGCAKKTATSGTDFQQSAVDEGSDSNDTETAAEGLSTTFIGGSNGSVGLASASDLTNDKLSGEALGDGAKAFYQPSGCLTVTDDTASSTATYVFANCTGPWGLVHVTGTVTVQYTIKSTTEITLAFAAKGLQINGASIDWNASADITASGEAREMVWDGQFSGTTRHGRDISRTNHKDYKWTVGQQCLSVTGSSDGTVTGDELQTDVINFSVCKGSCPESGSEIKITDKTDGDVYDLTYGNDTATYTGPAGNSINYTPLCAL